MERVIISVSISNDIKERAERAIEDGKLGISDLSALVEYALDHLLCIKEVGDIDRAWTQTTCARTKPL